MNILFNPIDLMSRGGSSAASGAMILALECLVVLLLALIIRRLIIFSGVREVRVAGRVTRKYVIPEHREWQGKAYVTVPEKHALEIDVENRPLQFAPAPWKYDRVSEGDQIDVAIQRARIGNEVRILDIGPF
jgi:hypothetical protein